MEASGGVSAMTCSPRLQAQVAILIWWDCTFALLSRSECIFSSQYYDFIVRCEVEDGWNMFSISGVPKELFHYLVEIVQLAHEKEQISKMRYAIFDTRRVFELEEKIAAYSQDNLPPDDTINDDEAIQHWHDCRHGVEAWKYALLLYISRVLKWTRTEDEEPPTVFSLARLTLDSVRSCRSTSMVQKQLLLPVFLAGAESKDAYARRFALDYCDEWSWKCRFHMFQDAATLLKEVWDAQDRQGDASTVWWGSVMEEEQRKAAYTENVAEYLFG